MVQPGMSKCYLAVEIGGTKQQAALGNEHGEILETRQGRLVYRRGAPDILDWLKENVMALMNIETYKGNIDCIGVGFGGPLESRTGRVLSSLQVKGWKDFELKTWFEEQFGLPAVIVNDTVTGGVAEMMLGAGKDSKNFFYTNIGTGIGGGLYINRNYYDGIGFGASYLGNSFIPDWTSEKPGAMIRLEKICSGKGIEERLRQKGYVPENSYMYQCTDGNTDQISCIDLAEGVRRGDCFCQEELDRIAESFAVGLCNILALQAPDTIVIGGGVAKMGDILFDRIRRFTDQLSFIASKGRYQILESELMDDAVLAGALLIAAGKCRLA